VHAISPIDPRRCGAANRRFSIGASPIQEQIMAKGQKRSSRESKKPKKAKLKAPATATSTVNAKLNQSGRGKKK